MQSMSGVGERLEAIHKAESQAGGYLCIMIVKKCIYRRMLPLIKAKLEFALKELERLESEI